MQGRHSPLFENAFADCFLTVSVYVPAYKNPFISYTQSAFSCI